MSGIFFKRCLYLLVCLLLIFPPKVSATHLMGGELTYTHDGNSSGSDFYLVKLIVYRYCDSTITTAQLDQSMFLGIYIEGASGILEWYSTESLTLINSTFVTSGNGNPGCSFTASACIERGEYEASILLPNNSTGYHLVVERCCRNGNIMNIASPGSAGMNFYAFIPPGLINSSPQITDVSIPYLCAGDTVSIINNAFDPDGDSLAYSFVVPYNGYSGQSIPVPDPFLDNNPYVIPIPEIIYSPGFTSSDFLGTGSYASIDPISGLTNYYIPNQGFYVAAIEIREYRNSVLLSTIRRDLQFITIPCLPNSVPNFSTAGVTTVFNIDEGQTLCFDVTFIDVNGDSLFLVASGPLLDSSAVYPAGIIPDVAGDSIVTSEFCWTPVCGMSSTVPYQFFVTVTDNGCPAKISNEIFSVYVSTGPVSQIPTVAVQQTSTGLNCQGSDITFTATSTNAGTGPQFFWQLNGVAALSNSMNYIATNLSNGDTITVTMISDALCLTTDTTFSPPYVVTILTQQAPQINITSNPAVFLCPQQICLFTANFTNGGAVPIFEWNLNGNPAGTNNSLFTAANPSGSMTVYATITPSTGCPPEISDTIQFNIVPSLVPQVLLTASLTDSICPNQQINFTATASNIGNPPIYTWYLNGNITGDTTAAYTLSSFNEGDEIYVTATSDYKCLSPGAAVSDTLVYSVYPPLAGNLTDGPVSICAGITIDLSMNANGGNYFSYQYSWSDGSPASPLITMLPGASGYYTATVDDDCYSPVSDSIFIEVIPVPVTDFTWEPNKPSALNPHIIFMDQSTDAFYWNWSLDKTTLSDQQNPEHDYPVGGIYPITLITTNQFGCSDTLSRIMEVATFITTYMPNSFTPNGDGRNDEFGMTGIATGGYAMRIINRWGQEVFRSESGYEKWTGKNESGTNYPEGVYIYSIVIAIDPSKKPYTGTITLIR